MLRTRLVAGRYSSLVVSIVFASILTATASLETFLDVLKVTPGAPAPITLRLPDTARNTTAPLIRASEGDLLPRGAVVQDDSVAHRVNAFENARRPPRRPRLVAQWFLYFLLAWIASTYLRTYSSRRGSLLRTQVGFLGVGLATLIVAKAFLLFTSLSALWLPAAFLPLCAALFLDRRTGLMMSLVFSVLFSSLIGFDALAASVFWAASAGGVMSLRDRKHSIAPLIVGLNAASVACAVCLAFRVIQGPFNAGADLQRGIHSDLLSASAGGLAAGVALYLLQAWLYPLVGVVSRARLLDLADLDNPLLLKMSAEAPGSWEHSRAMANLAEAAAASIGADALLTRVGAYYHDLGKTCQCKYFVENLNRGEPSPHEELEPDVSADAIMAHVVEGTRILRDGGIPEAIVEFAYTHHGTSVIEFFWHKCLAQGNPKGLTEDAFRYGGMTPRTKETAILMLIDSIEAGSRTIDPPSREKFEEMVQRIIFVKLKQGQLDESGLTIKDLRVLATRITDTLCSAHHTRIRYPWQDARDRGETPLPVPDAEHPTTPKPSDNNGTSAAVESSAISAASTGSEPATP